MSKLYIIPTPIGNLGDITYRAVEIMGKVDLLLAEDTRQTRKLLNHFNISVELRAYHQHNEHRQTMQVVEQIRNGTTIGLVSDAGTPGISDPGFLLVRECVKQGVEVECLPGPTALIPALINSGFPADRFIFEGFLPHKKGRVKRLTEIKEEKRTVIFYESPHRIMKLLSQMSEILGVEREVSVSRELSKIYEETVRGTLEEVTKYFTENPAKGEIVVVVKGLGRSDAESADNDE